MENTRKKRRKNKKLILRIKQEEMRNLKKKKGKTKKKFHKTKKNQKNSLSENEKEVRSERDNLFIFMLKKPLK